MAGLPPVPGSPSALNRRADARYAGKDLETQCVHAGERWASPDAWPSSTPIHNATTFSTTGPRTSTTWSGAGRPGTPTAGPARRPRRRSSGRSPPWRGSRSPACAARAWRRVTSPS